MASTSYFRAQLVTNSATTLFTASASTSECNSLDIFNRLAVAIKIDVWHENAAGSTLTYLVKSFTLDAGASFSYRGAIGFDENSSKLRAQSDTATAFDVIGRVTVF